MTAPPYTPRAPGGTQALRVLVKMSCRGRQFKPWPRSGSMPRAYAGRTPIWRRLTAPRTPTSVTSSTFSIGALLGSAGGERSSVDRSSLLMSGSVLRSDFTGVSEGTLR